MVARLSLVPRPPRTLQVDSDAFKVAMLVFQTDWPRGPERSRKVTESPRQPTYIRTFLTCDGAAVGKIPPGFRHHVQR